MKLVKICKKYNYDYDKLVKTAKKYQIPVKWSFVDGEYSVEDDKIEELLDAYYNENKDEIENFRDKERRIQEEKRLQEIAEANKKRAMASMLITSGFNFEGYRITKYSGYISGDDAVSVNRGFDGWISRGENISEKLMESLTIIRRNAIRELKEAAYNLDCNAVIGVDFDYITLDPQTANATGGTTYQPYVFGVTANGTAVRIEKIED